MENAYEKEIAAVSTAPQSIVQFVRVNKLGKSPLLQISNTRIVRACVDCIVHKDLCPLDMFPLRSVEMIDAILIIAANVVMTKNQKSQLPCPPLFSLALRGQCRRLFSSLMYIYVYIYHENVTCFMSHVFLSVRYPHKGGASTGIFISFLTQDEICRCSCLHQG